MTRTQKLTAIRAIVRKLGERASWEENGKTVTHDELILLNLTLYANDVYTSVSVGSDHKLTISGYDGNEGWSIEAGKADDDTIERVYAAAKEYDAERDDINGERYMTVAAARAYIEKVLSIVETELKEFGTVRTYHERAEGVVWTEGITVDTGFDESFGSYVNTRTICYHVRSRNDKIAYIRKERSYNHGYHDNLPYYGTAEEAAAYLLEEFHEMMKDAS